MADNDKKPNAPSPAPSPAFEKALRKALNTPPLTNKQVKEQAAKEREQK